MGGSVASNFNTAQAQGGCRLPSSSAPSPGYDYGAAQRAQEAAGAAETQRQAETDRIERERLAEEKRKKEIRDAEFIRDRDAAVSTLKGSSGAAMTQLKGLAGADNSGLKGSRFDTDSSGLKGLRGSEPADQDARLKPATSPTLSGSAFGEKSTESSKSKETCPPSQDSSVVDLCFLDAKPAVLDPKILKGLNSAERSALSASARNMNRDLLPFDKEMYQGLADAVAAESFKRTKRWPGPMNPGERLINPLNEPGRVKAYWDHFNAGLQAHAKAQAKIVASPKATDWRDIYARLDADPKFKQSIEQILSGQYVAERLAREEATIRLMATWDKKLEAGPARLENDKLFVASMVMERDAILKKMDQDISEARGNALRQVTALVSGRKGK